MLWSNSGAGIIRRMKMHTPVFIIGLLTFVTPFLGLPSFAETVIIAVYGISVMIMVSSCNVFVRKDMQHGPQNVASNQESHPQV